MKNPPEPMASDFRIPSPADFESWVKEIGFVEKPISLMEVQTIQWMRKLSDDGRYTVSSLLINPSLSLVPSYMASLGHKVLVVEDNEIAVKFQANVRLALGVDYWIGHDSFLKWSPEGNVPDFTMVSFMENIGRIRLSRRDDFMEDSGDSIAITKARGLKAVRGHVVFSLNLVQDNLTRTQMSLQQRYRIYSQNDVEQRIFSFCESGIRQSNKVVEPTGTLVSWAVR